MATTTTKTHSQARLDLNPRMSSARRPPRPDASSPSAAPTTDVEQNTQLFLTYSQFLRNFDATPISFNEDYRHRPSFAISPFTETYSGLEPGPSRHSGFYPSDQRQDIPVGPGYRKDVFEREQWVRPARIEEVDDDDVMGASLRKSNDGLEDNFATPKVQSISTAFASTEKDDDGSIPSQDDMPLPHGRRLRAFRSFRPISTISEYHSLQATSTASAVIPPSVHANGPTNALDDSTEVSLVREVLNLLIASQEDVKFMNTVCSIVSSSRAIIIHFLRSSSWQRATNTNMKSHNISTCVRKWKNRSLLCALPWTCARRLARRSGMFDHLLGTRNIANGFYL